MIAASQQALTGMRDLATMQWYVIPLLANTFYIYTREFQKARGSGDWNAIFGAARIFRTARGRRGRLGSCRLLCRSLFAFNSPSRPPMTSLGI